MELKISILIILLSISSLFAGRSYSQTAKVSLDMQNKTLEQVMDEIEKQSEFYFVFNQKQIDVNRVVDVKAENRLITDILPVLFEGTDVNYYVFDRKILLSTDPIDKELRGITRGVKYRVDDQQQVVTGKVTDSQTGEPMPGVNVVVKGTTIGAITDANGNYSINVPDRNVTLVFSFIGYTNQEVPLGGRTTLDISLVSETIGLGEVVVVGYGTQKSSKITGAVSTVDSRALQDAPVSQLTQMLQGKLSGVRIQQASGRPGEGMKIQVRGAVSLTAGSNPLYVVDGMPIVGDISFLSPDEIESITILKDPSSASLYGSRSSNGVILIQTKSGLVGKPKVEFSAFYGYEYVPENRRFKMMNAKEWAQFQKEIAETNGRPVNP
ncbi:MAG: carboxypeptidase-like regulatory domain-containing protein, partial [Bacteroidales bacterium]